MAQPIRHVTNLVENKLEKIISGLARFQLLTLSQKTSHSRIQILSLKTSHLALFSMCMRMKVPIGRKYG